MAIHDRRRFLCALAVMQGAMCGMAGAQPTIRGLNPTKGLGVGLCVSADGSIVCGFTTWFDNQPARWVTEGGFLVLEPIALAADESGEVVDCSNDGGAAMIWVREPVFRTLRWDGPGEVSTLQALPEWRSMAGIRVTPDGAIVGRARLHADNTFRAVRWPREGAPEVLPLPVGAYSAEAWAVDDAGNIYGPATFSARDVRVCRFGENGIAEPIMTMPEGSGLSDVSRDGSAFIGSGQGETASSAWIWTAEHGLTTILQSHWSHHHELLAVNANGTVVFGRRPSLATYVWTREGGIISQDEYFRRRGLDLAGWSELDVQDVSADDRVYVGAGLNPEGWSEGFVITLDACPSDFDADGRVNTQDFFDFVVCFFDSSCARADFNADHVVNTQDFFDFLAAFLIGC